MIPGDRLLVPAMEIQQKPNNCIYAFAIDGKVIPQIASVSRVGRGADASIRGYQRPEVVNHIKSIRNYIESDNPILPSAVVIAFDRRVEFISQNLKEPDSLYRQGHLSIPIVEDGLPGFVVDGQQRIAAIRDANVDNFPILVSSFIAIDEHEQRAQFILVNNTKPLPKGLIHELLPSTNALLPVHLIKKKFPAALLEELNYRPSSPLHGMIKTATSPTGLIKDNSILRMIENSLSDGALYRYRNPITGMGNIESMYAIISSFFIAVRDVFKESWGLPPRMSRLLHGVGIVSLGYVMDSIAEEFAEQSVPSVSIFINELSKLKPYCAWSSGQWTFNDGTVRNWNQLQNVPSDIQMLTSYLLSTYDRLSVSENG